MWWRLEGEWERKGECSGGVGEGERDVVYVICVRRRMCRER